MLSKLREQLKEELQKRSGVLSQDDFLPFLNERDSVGRVIRPVKHSPSIQPEEILQSLKMTTQEFFSRKKFKKDLRRFYLLKRSLYPKEMDYDTEVSQCQQLLSKLSSSSSSSNLNSQLFYDVDKRTTEHMDHLRKTFSREKRQRNGNGRQKIKKQDNMSSSAIRAVNTEIFREVDRNSRAAQSQLMANWTRCSVPYRQHLQTQVRKPERSNYADCVHRIFLGRELHTKQPKKSIRH